MQLELQRAARCVSVCGSEQLAVCPTCQVGNNCVQCQTIGRETQRIRNFDMLKMYYYEACVFESVCLCVCVCV